MTCTSPPQLADQELLAHLDGEASPEVEAHLVSCPHCRERAQHLARLQARLAARLYRATCPSPLELGEYHLGILAPAQKLAMDQHLATCLHCSHELEQLEAYVSALAPDIAFSPLERIKVLVARLVRSPEDHSRSGARAPAPAYAGLRGESESLLLYQVDDIQIAVEFQDDAERQGRLALLGLVTGADTSGMEAHLWQPEQHIAAIPVDELGNFYVSNLAPGSYELVLRGPKVEVQIPELEIVGG